MEWDEMGLGWGRQRGSAVRGARCAQCGAGKGAGMRRAARRSQAASSARALDGLPALQGLVTRTTVEEVVDVPRDTTPCSLGQGTGHRGVAVSWGRWGVGSWKGGALRAGP